ncbi:MAG TPA: hypothetical protein PK411_12540 [Mesotoga infera]|nr:hypothetical protein [Mesotoga infera]HPD39164.1 hypothetical protein [Mesotoga infera]HRR45089.1 hypothetical protein [Mesotoga sp.]HRV02604.1 hypothetical protein [Mesotoga sp.]
MKRSTFALSVAGLLVVFLLSGCFIITPMVGVSNLINDFEKYWEQESAVALGALYTEPAFVSGTSYTRNEIAILYGMIFNIKNVSYFQFLSDKNISFKTGLNEADVTFLARIGYMDGTYVEKNYSWTVVKIGNKWYITQSNSL